MSQDVFHIRMGKHDEDLRELLVNLKGTDRSKLIKDALRFYISYGEKLDKISQGIEQILTIIVGGKAPDLQENALSGTLSDSGKPKAEGGDEQAQLEKLVQDSIMDILNM